MVLCAAYLLTAVLRRLITCSAILKCTYQQGILLSEYVSCDSQSVLFFPSIEFDRDCDYFAIAGVTKKIKVYEYGTVIQDAVDIHYPENEMTCNSKIR